METAILILLVAIIILQVVQMMRYSYFKGESYRRWNTLEAIFTSATNLFSGVAESVKQISESKRLSTVLTFEAKKDLDIKPEEFEAKKAELRSNMLEALEKGMATYRSKSGRIESPDTVAYVTLDHSGFDQFVTNEVRSKAKNALARLIANQNIPAAKRFITVLANNL